MQGTQIQPLFDYVLIKPVASETKTASGIVLPDNAKEKPSMGEVMAIGPGKASDDCCGGGCCGDEHGAKTGMVVKKGDKVLYKKWAGNEVKVGNEEWLLVEVKDIMAIVK
jgi:chaperonin GroES